MSVHLAPHAIYAHVDEPAARCRITGPADDEGTLYAPPGAQRVRVLWLDSVTLEPIRAFGHVVTSWVRVESLRHTG